MAEWLGIPELVLVGQSRGAHTAMLTAAQHPGLVRRLILVEGGVGGDGAPATDGTIGWFESWPTPFPSGEDAVAFFGGGAAGDAWTAGLEATAAGLEPRFDVDVLRAALSPVHARPRWEEWGALRCPLDLIRGEHGLLQDEEVARIVRGAGFAIGNVDATVVAQAPKLRPVVAASATARAISRRIAGLGGYGFSLTLSGTGTLSVGAP